MTINNNIKAVSYCRVSSKEQEESGYSLDAQEKLLQEYAKNKFFIARTFRISESASGRQIRKTFNEMLQHATKNNIPIILCEKIDRLTRNLKDAASVSDWLADSPDREIHFVKESFVVNQNTRAHENLVWDMKVAIARFYTNNLSEEVKKGHKEKAAQGWLPTKPPLGYKTIGDKGHKTHVIDQNTGPLVKRMFQLYSSGSYSLSKLLEVMHSEGLRMPDGRKMSRSRLHQLLSDPFYYGQFRWKGEFYQGNHEPLITKDLFQAVQRILVRKTTNPQYKVHHPVFKAKIRCDECAATITWTTQKGHWYAHHSNYQKYRGCTSKRYVRQEAVEKQLFLFFDDAAPKSQRVMGWLECALKDSQADEIDYHTAKRNELTELIKSADRRIENAYRDKLDGKIQPDLCERIMRDSSNEKGEAVESLQKLGESRTKYYEAGWAIHELARKAKIIYLNPTATVEEKRLLLSYVFSDMTISAAKIRPNYTLAFEFLTEWMPKVNKIFEPTKNPAYSEILRDPAVTRSNLEPPEPLEPRKHFRTSKNSDPKARFPYSTTESRLLLEFRDSFRTFEWEKAFPCPETALLQMRELLALV